MKEGKRQYQFRVNGLVMPYLRIQHEIDGAPSGRRQIAVEDAKIGWVVIDDNEDLADSALSKFALEVRDYAAPSEYRLLPNKGWRKVSTREVLNLLEEISDQGLLIGGDDE
jgi:hypothetical protein